MRTDGTALFCLAAALLALGADLCLGEGSEAVTRPSDDVALSFARPGRIEKVLVNEGERVKAGQVLAQLDDAAEQVQLRQLKAEADDTIRVRAAEAQLAQAKVDLKEKDWAYEHNAATKLEVEYAQLEVKIKDLSLELARFEHEQSRRKYEEARLRVARMRLVSPIDGRVEKIMLRAGESADALEDVIQVVKLDILWVDVPVPIARVRALKLAVGGRAQVAFPKQEGSGNRPPAMAKIIHVAGVAELGTSSLRVRVEVPNPSSAPAGEPVTVTFPAPAAAAGAVEERVPLSEKPSEKKE